MNDDLIDAETLSLGRKSVLPGTGFFIPNSLDEEVTEERAAEALADADVAVIADPDPDGLGCVSVIRESFDGEVALIPAGPYDLHEALEFVGEYGEKGITLFICDLCPDDYSWIARPLAEASTRARGQIRWFDHHRWQDDIIDAVEKAGVDLVLGDSDEECTVDVAVRALDRELPEHAEELAAVTRDHDLWIKEDPRSDDLADYCFWVEPEEYVRIVGRFGPDLPEPVRAFVEERRIEKNELIDRAVARADVREVGPWSVAVTYGRCSQNEVADELSNRGADAAVIVKPAGSASIRGSDGFERAHEVARKVNGGGHPRAAGCKPPIYNDMLDYAHHWVTRGAETKRVILDAFEAVAREVEEEERAEGADEEDGSD